MAWRLAGSLVRLRDQVNAYAPNRSRASDGTIGDPAHASSASDHNPNGAGVVCAFDITHDPAGGLDAHALANHLIANRNSQLKYVISNSRIAGAWTGWQWAAYNGSNPHDHHIHVSVGVGDDGASQPPYDGTQDWNINYKGGAIMNPNRGDVDNIVGELWGRPPKPEDYGFTNVSWHDFIYNVLSAYPYRDRMKDYADAVEKRKAYENAAGIAEIRSRNLQTLCDALGVARLPDEQKTTNNIIAKFNEVQANTTQIEELKKQIAELSLRPTTQEMQTLKDKAAALEAEKVKDTETGNAFVRWIGNLFNKGS